MKRILFVCSQNRLRSPTAEQIFADYPGVETNSAGTNNDAENPLSAELIEWADLIVGMEQAHRSRIRRRFRSALKGKPIVVLGIPDEYDFMDARLIASLRAKMVRHLPSG